MDARRRFLRELFASDEPLTVVARRHGITRQTGALWRDRALEFGAAGLSEKSRAPRSRPNATPEKVVDLIVELRLKHPRWGPAKLRAVLLRDYPGLVVPAASTIGAILKRKGLGVPRRRRASHGKPPPSSLGSQDEPNQSWSMDHKGNFPLGNGQQCYPFTLIDAASRFLLAIDAFPSTKGVLVKETLTRVFREHGLPEAIRSDNGSPFAASTFSGLTKLSVWLVELGIRLDRIEPGKPQQNGRLERYHRTVKDACCSPPAGTMKQQQQAFDEHRRVYNEVRPHAALGQREPASAYRPSPREFPRYIRQPDYSDGQARRVSKSGLAILGSWRVPVGAVLAGKQVGFTHKGSELEVRFHEHVLGWLDPELGSFNNGRDVRLCRNEREWKGASKQ